MGEMALLLCKVDFQVYRYIHCVRPYRTKSASITVKSQAHGPEYRTDVDPSLLGYQNCLKQERHLERIVFFKGLKR